MVVTALVSLWPALLNGGPIWMPDTPSYMRAADAGYARLVGVSTDWSAKAQHLRDPGVVPAPEAGGTAVGRAMPAEPPVTLKGRSVYYGALLYAADLAGSLWWALLVQALLAALCITVTLSALGQAVGDGARSPPALLVGLGLAIATPLGFFVSYLMPDIFGGLALLAMMNLLFLGKQLSRRARIFLVAVLAYALLSHNLNLTLALLLLIGVVAIRLTRSRGLDVRSMAAVAGCVLVGFAGQAAFDLTVKRLTGAAPVRPPFLAMRLIADGPGLAYLAENCRERPFVYCRLDTTSLPHSDTLLWSADPERSLFRGLSYAEQRAAAAQQTEFALAVLQDRPLEVVGALSLDVLEQLFRFDMRGFSYSSEVRQRYADSVPERLFDNIRQSRAFNGTLVLRPTELLAAITTAVSLLLIGGFLYRTRNRPDFASIRAACLFILAAIALNAALCGALSGPKGRYQMRLIWIVPLVAAGLMAGERGRAQPGTVANG